MHSTLLAIDPKCWSPRLYPFAHCDSGAMGGSLQEIRCGARHLSPLQLPNPDRIRFECAGWCSRLPPAPNDDPPTRPSSFAGRVLCFRYQDVLWLIRMASLMTKDLGHATSSRAQGMTGFDPDKSWPRVLGVRHRSQKGRSPLGSHPQQVDFPGRSRPWKSIGQDHTHPLEKPDNRQGRHRVAIEPQGIREDTAAASSGALQASGMGEAKGFTYYRAV